MQNHVNPSKLPLTESDRDHLGPYAVVDFDQLIGAARRQARVVAVLAIAGLAVGATYVLTAVPEYTATNHVIIDSQKDKDELSASIAELTFDTGAIESQVEVLKSEKIALSVVASQRLVDDAEFMGARGALFGQAINGLRRIFYVPGWFVAREPFEREATAAAERAAVEHLKRNLDIQRVARTYVLAISYTSPDRNKAATIANAFADAYINEQLDAKFATTRRAAVWLQSRLTELKQQSLDSDLAIQRFKALHGIVVTGGDKPELISDQQLTELNEQIVAARGDTVRAEARYGQIKELLRSGRVGAAVPDSLSNPVINDLRGKYLAASKSETRLEAKLGPTHVQVIELKRETVEFTRLISEELQRIAESYRSDAEVARAKEQSLASSMSGLVGQSAITNEILVQLRQLEREAETYRSLYQTFMQRYQEALQQQSFPNTEARVITAATPPEVSSYPKQNAILALGAVIGAMAGAGVGALREHHDRVFRVAAQMRDELGLEFIGFLPTVEANPSAAVGDLDGVEPQQVRITAAIQRYAIDHPLSSFTETLRSAKVAVDWALGDRRPKIVGVISALPDEGKSTVAKNFASLLADLGAKTLLIDADLRNPGLTRSIARHAEAGLLQALHGVLPLAAYLLDEPDSGLAFLPAAIGDRVLHSSVIISSPAMRAMLAEAGQTFEYIVIDLPPLGPVVDVRAAISIFDAFILVAEWGRTPRAIVQDLLLGDEALYQKCVGGLYNKVNVNRMNLYESYGARDTHAVRYGKYYDAEKA